MDDFLTKAAMGMILTFSAAGLVFYGFPVEAILPALAGVIILWTVLIDAIERNY